MNDSDSGLFHKINNTAVITWTANFLFCGNTFEKKNAKAYKPQKSDSLPVNVFEKAAFKMKSFTSNKNNETINAQEYSFGLG